MKRPRPIVTVSVVAMLCIVFAPGVVRAPADQPTPSKAIKGTAAQRKERGKALKSIKPGDIKRHLFTLADDRMAGRESGAAGADMAAQYVAAQMRKLCIEPMGDDGGYFQPFGWTKPPAMKRGRGKIADANYLDVKPSGSLKIVSARYGKDYLPLAASGTGFVSAELLFAGYGLVDEARGWDSYAGTAPKGKVVVVLAGVPALAANPFSAEAGALSKKLEIAKAKGAAALVIVAPDKVRKLPKDDPLIKWPGTPAADAIPALYVLKTAAAKLLGPLKVKPGSRAKTIAKTGKPASYPLDSGTVSKTARRPVGRLRVSALGPITGGFKNIVGFIEGHDPELKKQLVVVGGHYDHVGMGLFGSRGGKGKIHNGADDNASGTSGVLEIAQAIQAHCKLKRSVMIILFDAEERGLLGSKFYCDNPKFPMGQTVAMFNIDMIARNGFKQIFIGASKRNPTIHNLLLEINKKYNITLRFDGMDKFTNRSDQYHFIQKGVPGIFFFGGLHGDYHTAGDDPTKCSLVKAKVITQLVFFVMYTVANLPEKP